MLKNIKNIKRLFVILFLLFFNHNLSANECSKAIQIISEEKKIPHDVLTAVALTETGTMQQGRLKPYPWAINVGGKGYLFSSKQKAIDAVKSYIAAGKTSIDIGCMQLNWYWHKQKFNYSIEAAFDPLTNITVGANYIQEHYQSYHNWDKAVGRYHSGTAKFATLYHQRYAVNLKIAQKYSQYNDNHNFLTAGNYQTEKTDIAVITHRQYAGALIEFKATDTKVIALIDMKQKILPIIDTRRRKPLL